MYCVLTIRNSQSGIPPPGGGGGTVARHRDESMDLISCIPVRRLMRAKIEQRVRVFTAYDCFPLNWDLVKEQRIPVCM